MKSSGGHRVRTFHPLRLTLTLVMLLAGFTARAGQTTPQRPATPPAARPGRTMVVVVDVKPGMWDDYVALQKAEAIPALRKGGVEGRTAWRSATVGPAYRVAYVYRLQSFATLDEEPPMRRALGADGEKTLTARLRAMVLDSRSYVTRLRSELGFGTSAAAEPALGVLTLIRTLPGQQAAFEGVLKQDWVPALRKGGVRLYIVHEVVMGGDVGEYFTFTPIDSLAALDLGHPMMRRMGAGTYAAAMARIGSTTCSVERIVIRRDPDLSFVTKKATTQ